MATFTGKWICSKDFADLKPIDIFHREHNPNKDYSHSQHLKNLHTVFKKKFNLNSFKNVIIRITADDQFKLFIGGKYAGQGPTAGYHFCYYYNEFDITDLLVCGENEITIDVYYMGEINRVYGSGDYRMGVIADIISDGQVILTTDNTWEYAVCKAFSGPCDIGYKTQYSEYFDSRIKTTDFSPATEKQTDHIFADKPSVNLQVYDKKAPIIRNLKNGGVFLDFCQEITATLRITATGNSGDTIVIHYGEELNSDNTVRYKMRCNCNYEDRFILNGKTAVFSGYDYKAFRYVELLPQNSNIIIDDVVAVVRHYPFDDDACTIKSNDEILNGVFGLCKNGVKYGSQDVFVDCPSREKGQYAGDLTVTGASHLYLTGDIGLFEKAIINQAQSQTVSDGVLAVTPGSYMQEIADYSLQFPILLLRHYNHTGDREFLASMLPVCEKLISHFKSFDRGDGMLELVDTWNLVDWPDNLRDNYDFDLKNPIGPGCHNVINAFYVGCVTQIERIKDILGIEHNHESIALKTRFNQVFFNESTNLYVDSEGSVHSSLHANTIPMYYGLQPHHSTETIANHLIEKGLVCGVYMSYFYLKALAGAGRYDAVYKTITSKGRSSWYNMIKEGGTTCFEAWGKDQKFNTSLCHPWASAPISVIIEDLLGLECTLPGWKDFNVTPHLPKEITIKAKVPVKGKIINISATSDKSEFSFTEV